MNHRDKPRFLAAFFFATGIACSTENWAQAGARIRPGVVVEKVEPGGAAELAGIKPGDILLSWKRSMNPPANPEPARGPIADPFDLFEVELEEAPRGEVTLLGERGGAPLVRVLPPGDWIIAARPRFDGRELADWLEGKSLLDESDRKRDGIARWEELAERFVEGPAGADHPLRLSLWLRLRIADELAKLGEKATAHAAARRVILEAENAGDQLVAARGWRAEAIRFRKENEPGNAEDAYICELGLREKLAADSRATLAIAICLNSLGIVARSRGDLASAESFHRRSLAIRENLAPGSLAVAASSNNLGNVAAERGDLASAEIYFRRSHAIEESFAPGSVGVAGSLNNLGLVAKDRGDLASAESFYRRALAIKETLAPGSLAVAASLNNLGNLVWSRGDLAAAEVFHRRSLAIKERLDPGSLGIAASWNNLGNLAWSRGDLASAESFYRRSLAIEETLAPGSLGVARSLNSLGAVAAERGDLASAANSFHRALAIEETLAPGSLDVALSLNSLGVVAANQGNLASAESLYHRSLAITEKLAPGSLAFAESLTNLGEVASREGNLPEAARLLGEALAIQHGLAPGSAAEAKTLHSLGAVSLGLGLRGAAGEYSCEALRALESQSGRLGGSDETRAGFAAKFAEWYREYAQFLVESGEPEQAFHVLERSRARGLLSLLAERDLVLAADIPPDLERERKFAAASYDRAQAKLAELSGSDTAAIEAMESEMREIRRRQEEIKARISAASRRLATLVYPEPLDLAGATRLLEPGTLLLAYSLGEKSGLLFLLGPGEKNFEVVPLDTSREEIEADTRQFRRAIERAAAASDADGLESVRTASARLGALVLAPAAHRIAAAKRLLVIPDGPLHFVPFGALAATRAARGAPQSPLPLGEGKPRKAPLGREGDRSLPHFPLPLGEGKPREARLGREGDRSLPHFPLPLGEGKPREARLGEGSYLIEFLPISTVVSMTVYAELVAGRSGFRQGAKTATGSDTDEDLDAASKPLAPGREHSGHSGSIVAFGDPVYPASAGSRIRGGSALPPLPATRTEVEAIRALAPTRATNHLGAYATESRAKAIGRDAGIVHFACHGIVDERFPLDSALALTMPDVAPDALSENRDDNGLLQAWEIFESVRLDADLVTLSACDTAMGKEMGGEGLVGLVRAFEFAGARSVLASLWSVGDASTAKLMKSFYRHWLGGIPKDEALRQAQLELFAGGGLLANPFHWAAFELIGDRH